MRAVEPHRALELLIQAAFVAAPRPGGFEVASHECPECDHLRRTLGRHQADEVPENVIDYFRDSLPLLAPDGLRYYLPAYLVRALRDPNYEGVDYLIYHLAPSKKDLRERDEYWASRLAVFTPGERAAVLAFVSWLAETETGKAYAPEIERALRVWAEHA